MGEYDKAETAAGTASVDGVTWDDNPASVTECAGSAAIGQEKNLGT